MEEQDLYSIEETISKEISCLKELEKILKKSNLSKILDKLQSTKGRLIFTGMGKSGIIAQKIVASLSSTGTPALFIHPAEASHGDLGMISQDDLLVAISNSGESKELADIVNYCKRFAIVLIGITKNPQSTLAKYVDDILLLPDMPEADPLGLAPTSSTTATLVLGDIITIALMNRKKFTKQDFQIRHPGGKLGTILQRVRDIMHKGNDMPVLPQEAHFPTILLEMSKKRLGCVGFVDKEGNLSGIFTDGDLRRKMSSELFAKQGVDLMTKNPYQISQDMLCSQALHLMNLKKIPTLFITENKKPIGIVHIHDLIQWGV